MRQIFNIQMNESGKLNTFFQLVTTIFDCYSSLRLCDVVLSKWGQFWAFSRHPADKSTMNQRDASHDMQIKLSFRNFTYCWLSENIWWLSWSRWSCFNMSFVKMVRFKTAVLEHESPPCSSHLDPLSIILLFSKTAYVGGPCTYAQHYGWQGYSRVTVHSFCWILAVRCTEVT